MEKRFEIINGVYSDMIKDYQTNTLYTNRDIDVLTELLNEQDEKIKQLEEQLSTVTMYHGCDAIINELKQENQQLKQSQNSKAIEVLERVREFVVNDCGLEPVEAKARLSISKYIKEQITKLRGGENEGV